MFFGYNSHIAYWLFSRYKWIPRWLCGAALRIAEATAWRIWGAQSRNARRLRKIRRSLNATGLDRHIRLVDWTSSEDRLSIYSHSLLGRLDSHERTSSYMTKYFEEFEGVGDLNRHSHVLIQSFLAAHNFLYADKSSMAASVEVRVPFMDVDIMKLCARMPERYKLNNGTTKYMLKKAMESCLPKEIIHRKKAPFGAPLRKWIAEDLDPLIEDLLGARRIDERGLFNPKAVRHIIEENRDNKADNSYFIYALITLEIWMQTFLDRPGEEVVF